ncbi:type I restriction endonuclease subunit R [Cytophagaceae bacterium DM2B3-1]|uniref:Type I restriction enzyme endonuclease subunit n=1 Tax=Xanthocytophaga flava TaxID=3048013 RepID=A0ABT7CIX2_9BACT|nr:type I restriction endonuclease subunit R [Xanthocytophaga flavus]MDJ1493679.1 type I restriction endonuclease subunit R [Xanthocytophaga flavus]
MAIQSEKVLEDNLIDQLIGLGYSRIVIRDEAALLANLKKQLEIHNNVTLTEKEFAQVLNHLNKGSVFDRSKTLRDKMQLTKEDGTSVYLEFINQQEWCRNQYQVTNQITISGVYQNRYDVTILINGLPLAQIELKRRGLELKEAFNQTNRYQRHSYSAGFALFQYIQIFVISNGVNTKYYANNKKQTFKQTYFWADKDNKTIRQLDAFTAAFLEKCHLSKMITKYTVLQETYKIPMIMRPYQYYATEAIIDRVKNSTRNGYIWHTTGSGKTLTSFKTSQLLTELPQVHKVVFVVDRKDLDYQTQREFDSFSPGSVDTTKNTHSLVKQLADNTKIIVTTIQKLNTAISKPAHQAKLDHLKDKRVVFIFDECHRSQFGETHKKIKKFFNNSQMFGFTGTPIFADNAIRNESGKHTTAELFEECLHKYVITDAIRDENVLKFSIEYIGRYRQRDDSRTELDIDVEAIDTKELVESEDRLDKITDYIIANHSRKTHKKAYTGIFCVSSVDTLIRYYDMFKRKKDAGKHDLRIATIFSYGANPDDKDANGMIEDVDIEVDEDDKIDPHHREKLDKYIEDYNALYNTKYSTKDSESFYNYYKDIAKRIKEREKEGALDKDRVDILLVVNMFLTGFDAKMVNTLYADKNLKYHGLIQAFSRTNRIITEQKSQGNIVSFRNLKKATDDAITLFSNKEAIDVIIMKPYEDYVAKFNEAYQKLLAIAPTVDSVDDLPSEEEELEFVKAFRELMRLKNVLVSFSDFTFEHLTINEQVFEDYKSKYLDLHDKVRTSTEKEKESILDDVDFELELIQRDEINVAYILRLLAALKDAKPAEAAKQRKEIANLLASEVQLRSKRELIEKFISQNLPQIANPDDIPQEFDAYMEAEKQKALDEFVQEERVDREGIKRLVDDYIYTQRTPLRDDVIAVLEVKPKLLERKTIAERIIKKIRNFVETFLDGMPEV